ncbi:hypothetical protein O181_044138 [Austropuccinia psidii MF-1]|uniref:Retrovirus-related Pol polyprotein from transposon TNT 1-94-like beta-barrel domain-containing protein n=1 Tax=Austropuccinia psidii MF-1 TaxID=1389203 RepID=A0A9Q3DMS8_9BASI|nr:hypothetical protein [Austropuccinia psidii MF-1]
MDLESVNIHVPNEILTSSLLGKLRGDRKLYQLVEGLTLNEEVIQRPDIIFSRLQDYVKLMRIKEPIKDLSASALVSTINEPYKVVYYCTDGKHNPKCTMHKKEECFSEQPHLQPKQKDKRKIMNLHSNAATNLSTVQALVTSIDDSLQHSQLLAYCGATHHMFNSKSFFLSISDMTNITFSTGDSNSALKAHGIGTVRILFRLLDLFGDQLTINQKGSHFSLVPDGKILLRGRIANRLMYVDYSLPRGLLSINSKALWHNFLGHPGPTRVKILGLPSGSVNCITCNLNKAH